MLAVGLELQIYHFENEAWYLFLQHNVEEVSAEPHSQIISLRLQPNC